jgi:hypothetical protein
MTEIGLGDAKPKATHKKGKPVRRAPQPRPSDDEMRAEGIDPDRLPPEFWDEARKYGFIADDRAAEAEAVDTRAEYETHIPADELLTGRRVETQQPNPYAPTGWGPKTYTEMDVVTPTGQNARIRRLERSDLMRLNLMEQLNTFAPMLLETNVTDAEREAMMQDEIKRNPASLTKMYAAMDKVVQQVCLKPRVTDEQRKVNYGNPQQWADPNFVATVHINDIDQVDRTFIFGVAFGRDVDDLKSFLRQAEGVAGLENLPGV